MVRGADLLCRYHAMAVAEVAEQCGFDDPSSFTRAFG